MTQCAVLIVEDLPSVRATAADMFRQLGCRVFEAWNAADALSILSNHPEIEILFTDLRMPGLDGVELAERAHRLRPRLRIVLTSAYSDDAPLPDIPFLRKPWRFADLQEVVGWRDAADTVDHASEP
jgi:two-component system, cell cycle response regulator CpdR